MAFDLHDHQLDALGRMKNGTVLRGGVGSGKSRTALAYFYQTVCGGVREIHGGHLQGDHGDLSGLRAEFHRPRDIYVITTGKKRDDLEWEGEAAHFAISTDRSASISGVQLKVDSWNKITEYTDVEGAFFIFDEQRLVGSGAWVKAFLKIARKNQWVLLTATPGDTWIEFAPIFIANGFYKNRTEFIDHHVVYDRYSRYPRINKYLDTRRLAALRDRILVEMPFERHTTRHLQELDVDYDVEKFKQLTEERWNFYEERPIRDAGELFRLMRALVNSDQSRIQAVRELFSTHPKMIVFYNFNFELELLRSLAVDLDIPVAEWNGHKHQQVPTGSTWMYLVQYTAGAEGWNCTTTDTMVFFSLNYSYKIFEQAQGRIDRMNTPFTDLHYFILKSNSLIDKMIQRALNAKETFNEKRNAAEAGWDLAA